MSESAKCPICGFAYAKHSVPCVPVAAPAPADGGERVVYRFCGECGDHLPTKWHEPFCTIHRALSRPSGTEGEADLRQTLEDVIGCCHAAERDALRWLYLLHHGSLITSEDGDLVLAMSWGNADDAPLTDAERVVLAGDGPNEKGEFGWVSGDVLNRVIDDIRGENAIGLPPAPPCIHERRLSAAPPAPVRVTEATDNVRRAAVGMAMMARDAMGSGKYTKACDDFDAALSALTAALAPETGREG